MPRDPSTNLLPALLALVSEPAWIIDNDNRILALNAPAAELFGLERPAMLGSLLSQYVRPESIALLREKDQPDFKLICENHQGQSFPMTCKVTMEQSYLLMVAKDVGNPPGDPTTGLLAEELLRQSPDAILVTDLQLRILRWLGSAEQLFGYTAGEVLGRTTEFLVSPEVLTARMPEFQRQLREGGVFRGELPVLHKDGHRLIVDVTAKVIYDYAGQPTGILGINRDVTERRQAEHELRRSEASYRTLLEYLPAGVLVHSPTTELLFCNRAAQ
jgi:PAS domain S-box-containing protein